MRIFTIGFTQKRAEQFFSMLDRPDIARIVDIRLKNNSQLAGFTRGADMPFLLERLVGKGYVHEPRLAPSDEILTAYRNNKIDWPEYERRFLVLLDERRVRETVDQGLLDGGCLLCSEPEPDRCHRRLVAEYISGCLPHVTIQHL